jgi:hypothetical protein
MNLRPVGAELFHAEGQTDRHDEANNRILQFCERAQNALRKCNSASSRSAMPALPCRTYQWQQTVYIHVTRNCTGQPQHSEEGTAEVLLAAPRIPHSRS